MEQALLNKLKDGTADDIDVEMIAARCKVAHNKLLDLMKEFTDKLKELTEEYEEEYRIGGISLVMGYTDKLSQMIHPGKSVITIAYGRSKYLLQLLEHLKEEATK